MSETDLKKDGHWFIETRFEAGDCVKMNEEPEATGYVVKKVVGKLVDAYGDEIEVIHDEIEYCIVDWSDMDSLTPVDADLMEEFVPCSEELHKIRSNPRLDFIVNP